MAACGHGHHGRAARHPVLSLRHAGGTDLVIFPANLVDGDHVAVHDPDHRLPPDQSSCPEPVAVAQSDNAQVVLAAGDRHNS
ncbi:MULTISPECIES: hypothetical protein [unclassified Mesorhizobium]|uniref:hypothetical protein n=1 Tax=unclassified Mesorhizobium TaxID=325217 RepID=UPI001FDFB316|nr:MULTISPECIES: hypothetical protein [unclassified Mesorhizobium]